MSAQDAVRIHHPRRIMRWEFPTSPRRRTMKSHLILTASLALAIATPAFAQDNSQSTPNSNQSADVQSSGDSQSNTGDAQQRHHHARNRQTGQQYNPAAEALTGNEPREQAYWHSDQQKTYPAVDHGHVPGDPPVINHNDDQTPVPNPTKTTITIPPSG
jgi:hypothetical protein